MMKKVFIAGATGWVGKELSKNIIDDTNYKLVGGLSRSYAGENLAEVLKIKTSPIPLFDTIENAMGDIDFDILIDFTSPLIAKKNILNAIDKGRHVLIGTSGLSNQDYEEIEEHAKESAVSVLAAGNFSITAVLLKKFAETAAQYIDQFEIIDYASQRKVDSPSGTVAELAYSLSKIKTPKVEVPIKDTIGNKETRGGDINGIQVHAIRLPGYVLGVETIFGMEDEKLIIKHEAGTSVAPYLNGIKIALAKMGTFKGLKRGLDTLMDL